MGTTSSITPTYHRPESVRPLTQDAEESVDHIFSHCLPALRRRAFQQLRNPADAEDALQDALLSAFNHWSDFEGRSQISTWLSAIVANSARMHWRKELRHEALSLDQTRDDEDSALSDRLSSAGPTPEEICQSKEMRRTLHKVMNRLSPPLRNAFQLRELNEMSTRQAARTLGVSEGTVKAQLFRARKQLQVLMAEALGLKQAKSGRTKIRIKPNSTRLSTRQ